MGLLVNEGYLINAMTVLRDEVLHMTSNGPEPYVEYTVIIDQENSNPKTSCTYADDAAIMAKGSAVWDLKPIFKDIKPCVFKDGAVVYYLNPHDWTKKVDGTASDLTGTDGDVMIEFPKFAYRIYTDTNNVLHVSVTNDPAKVIADTRYSYDAFSRALIGDLEHFYIGAFLGYIESNKLRSVAGKQPSGSYTIASFNTYAQNNGAHYQQLRYPQFKAIQCLYLIKYGNRNGQEALGYGVVNSSKTTCGYESTSTSASTLATVENSFTKPMDFGSKTLKTKHMRLFGIEDFWGNLYQFVKCLTTNGNRDIIYSWSEDSGENVEATPVTISSGYTSNFSGYPPKYVQGTTDAGFLPRTTSTGSTSTYWPDYCGLCASCVLYVGGDYSVDLNAGPFCAYLSFSASSSSSALGARLTFV